MLFTPQVYNIRSDTYRTCTRVGTYARSRMGAEKGKPRIILYREASLPMPGGYRAMHVALRLCCAGTAR